MFWSIILLALSTIYRCCALPSIGSGYRSAAYFVNWGIYDRNYFPWDLPVEKLTHVIYSFANVNGTTGEVFLSDSWADTDIHFSEDSWSNSSTHLFGCFNQLFLIKQRNRHLKVLLAIGGASYSHNFAVPASTPSGRSIFASTAVSLVKHLGLDGLDVDWEFPSDQEQAENLVLLLQAVREALDVYGQSLSPSHHFELSVSSPTGPSEYTKMNLAKMDPYVDFWNLMAYNYAGSWSSIAGHQANLFASKDNAQVTPFNTKRVVDYYISQGVPAYKLVLGMPLYGQAFGNTKGLSQPSSAVNQGTWEAGIYDYKDLPLPESTVTYDETLGASYSYSSTKQVLVSYDNVLVAKLKAWWVIEQGLGGLMWWESSGDKKGAESLIENGAHVLEDGAGPGLETSLNQISYPDSMYANIRTGLAN